MPSYYDDLSDADKESSPSSAESDEKDTKSKSNDDEDENANTALLPKSFFKNKDKLKPGDIEKIKIVHLYDDEAEVLCVYGKDHKKEKKDDSSDSDSEEMSNAMDRMDSEMA